MAIKSMQHLGLSLIVLLLTACAQERVILLPQADGSKSAVVFQSKRGGEAVLSEPYATAESSRNALTDLLDLKRPPSTRMSSAEEVARRYSALGEALPMRPQTFTVYFESGQGNLTAESESRMAEILNTLKTLPAGELVITGHTDSVGSISANDRVSQQRANIIRSRLIAKGIPPERIEAIGRGKRQLLVPTEDGVAEARNRRVEIRLK